MTNNTTNLREIKIDREYKNHEEQWRGQVRDILYLAGFLKISQYHVMCYIIQNIEEKSKKFKGTYKEISANTNLSSAVVSSIMKKFHKYKLIEKKGKNEYDISEILSSVKCTDGALCILIRYQMMN